MHTSSPLVSQNSISSWTCWLSKFNFTWPLLMSLQSFLLGAEKHLAPSSLSKHYTQSWRDQGVRGEKVQPLRNSSSQVKTIFCMQKIPSKYGTNNNQEQRPLHKENIYKVRVTSHIIWRKMLAPLLCRKQVICCTKGKKILLSGLTLPWLIHPTSPLPETFYKSQI